MARPQKHVFVCSQMRPPGHPRGSCGANGGAQVLQEFQRQFEAQGLWGKLAVTGCGCVGSCGPGASVLVYPEGVMYGGVSKEDVAEIIASHLLQGQPLERLKAPAEAW